MSYGDFQLDIYLAGLSGTVPSLPVSFAELETRAAHALPPSVLSYVAGGAGDEHTQRANVAAFRQWGLMPRMLVGAIERDLSVELFGLRLPSPVFLAPIGVIGLCGQDGHGDLAVAEACARLGVPMAASTLSADPLEEVAARLGPAPASSSSTPRPTGSWPKAWCAGPSRPGSRRSWSHWTPGSPAGARATWRPATSRSCGGTAWPITPATRCSGPGWRSRQKRTRRRSWRTGRVSSATR